MFVIVAYDVAAKRDGKMLKVCRKYLTHIQKSVFEGSITESKLKKLKNELQAIIDFDDDSICIYSFANSSGMVKEQIGVSMHNSPII